MSALKTVLITLLAVNHAFCQSSSKRYKLCVTALQSTSSYCNGLSTLDSEVNCVATHDSNDCAFKLMNQEADFAVFTAEQMTLVTPVINEATQVILQISQPSVKQPYKFRMGVVVEGDISRTTLRGKNYCHPGFEKGERNNRIMKVFESQLSIRPQCLDENLAIENELDSLSNFFGNMSCRPGRWTEDDDQEAILQRKYSSLCAICDNPDVCTNSPSQDNHHAGALRCLTEKAGQVAFVSIAEAQKYFKDRDATNYSFLCADGTRVAIGAEQPCAWYEEPLDAVVAVKSKSEIQTDILKWFSSGSPDWTRYLKTLISRNGGDLVSTNKKISDYVMNVTQSLKSSSCGRDIKWCTTSSAERKKCETLKRASSLHAIEPELNCMQANSIWECLNKTRFNEINILGIDTSLAYVAYEYYDVQPVKYQDPGLEDLYNAVAVIRSGTASSFQSLEKKDVCFPEYGGLAHLTIFQKLKKDKSMSGCLNDEVLHKFFEKTCVPRMMQIPRDPRQTVNVDKFCTLCSDKNCMVDVVRSSATEAKAIQCLVNNTNSVAFINANNIKEILKNPTVASQFVEGQYRFLCEDGQELPLNQPVTESCAYGSYLSGVIVGSKNLSAVQLKDIDLALLKMDSVFGSSSASWLFNMYTQYNGASDLLFKGKTVALASKTSKYVAELENLFDSVKKCTISAGFATPSSSVVMALGVSLSIFVFLLNR